MYVTNYLHLIFAGKFQKQNLHTTLYPAWNISYQKIFNEPVIQPTIKVGIQTHLLRLPYLFGKYIDEVDGIEGS